MGNGMIGKIKGSTPAMLGGEMVRPGRDRNRSNPARGTIQALILGSGFFLGAVVSCTDALPRHAPEGPLGHDIRESERVVSECARNADAARIERERAEQLLSEAKALAARAEEAERQCNQTVSQVGAAEQKVQRMFKVAASKRAAAKKAEETQAVAEPVPSVAPTPPPVLHSPSDAP